MAARQLLADRLRSATIQLVFDAQFTAAKKKTVVERAKNVKAQAQSRGKRNSHLAMAAATFATIPAAEGTVLTDAGPDDTTPSPLAVATLCTEVLALIRLLMFCFRARDDSSDSDVESSVTDEAPSDTFDTPTVPTTVIHRRTTTRICSHPTRALRHHVYATAGHRRVTLACDACGTTLLEQEVLANDCTHPLNKLDSSGSNQYGGRLKCSSCGLLFWRNTSRNSRFVLEASHTTTTTPPP